MKNIHISSEKFLKLQKKKIKNLCLFDRKLIPTFTHRLGQRYTHDMLMQAETGGGVVGYNSKSSASLVLKGDGWSAPRRGHFTPGGWISLGAGLDGNGKSRPHRDPIPELLSP
jgi:hypothetical protein